MSPISDIGAFRSGRWKLDWFLKAVRRAVEWAIDKRAVFDFLAHPSCLGVVDPEFRTVDLILDTVKRASGKAVIVSLDAIAAAPQRPDRLVGQERRTRGTQLFFWVLNCPEKELRPFFLPFSCRGGRPKKIR